MRVVTTITRRISLGRLRDEAGQGLVELLIALTILSIGVGSLLTLLAAGAVSLQRSQRSGTGLTLAEDQLELYRGVAYQYIRLSTTGLAAVPGSSVYMTANASDPTIPPGASSGQVLDSATPCTAADATLCAPVQTVTGPDHHSYEIDTYITQCPSVTITSCPSSADPVKQVFVVVRDAQKTSLPIVARDASNFSTWTTATS